MTATGSDARRPTLAVWKFASCDGCQLQLLSLDEHLLELAGQLDIAYFPEATRREVEGPYDLSLVEGSITTAADAERIRTVRAASHHLVTIGACATAGGIQALRNGRDIAEFVRAVYPDPSQIDALATSTAIAEHVPVDFELRGCPVDRYQLLEVVSAHLNGRPPRIPEHTVCLDCKLSGAVCVLVAGGAACLGPVTRTGCGALCPRMTRGCYGCFGPAGAAGRGALAAHLRDRLGMSGLEVQRLLATTNAAAPAFRAEHAGQREVPV